MLIGEKVILRPLKIEDLEKTHEWRNNLELIKLTQGIRFPKTMEMDREWFGHALNDKSNRNIYFGVDEKQNGEFIGIIQLNNIDYISGTASWGFVIGDQKNKGTGASLESQKLLFVYAFDILNLRKIYSYTIEFNKQTLNWLKKIGGFEEEGRLKKHVYLDGIFHDVIIMSFFKT